MERVTEGQRREENRCRWREMEIWQMTMRDEWGGSVMLRRGIICVRKNRDLRGDT